MIQRFLGCLLLLACFTLWNDGVLAASTLHVATNGNDVNPGTADRPLATLRKAVALAVAGNEPAEIVLARGIYPGDAAVGTPEDRLAGPQPPLVIRASQHPDGNFEEVVLDGGREIDKADPVADLPGVYKFQGRYSYHSRTHVWEADTRTKWSRASTCTSAPAHGSRTIRS